MSTKAPWFVEERAIAFASLLLTEQHDAIVRPQSADGPATDLLVEVRKDGKPTLRFFGVRVIAELDFPAAQEADKLVRAQLGKDSAEAMLPICVFVIGARKPAGTYRWVVEPVVEEGRALLRRDVALNWHPLDDAGVARLIGQVSAWYDALNGNPAPKTRRPAKPET